MKTFSPGAIALRWFCRWLTIWPRAGVSSFGAFAGALLDLTDKRKGTATDNILNSDLRKTSAEALRIIRTAYRDFGRTFFELLVLDRKSWRENEDYDLEWPSDFKQQIRDGAVFVSAHMGNWELMGKTLVAHGIPLAVVVHRLENSASDDVIQNIRRSCGMKVIYDDEPAVLRDHIERGFCIALLADQDFGSNRVAVSFLGRPCFAPEGPEFIARRFKRPVFICFALREGPRHRFRIKPLEVPEPTNRHAITEAVNLAIENAVRTNPEQWFWFHRRWKGRTV